MPLVYNDITDLTDNEETAEFERNLAVIIGINAYTNGIPGLETAGNDARRLANILCNQHDYEVFLFVDEELWDQDCDIRYQGPAGKNALQRFFAEKLPEQVAENHRVLVYFAGHGIALEGQDQEDGPEGFLIPQDADKYDRDTFLPMVEFNKALEELACRHLLLVLDCCFAGAIRWSFTRSLDIPPEKVYWEQYQMFVRTPAWQAITSAAYDQKALDRLVGNEVGDRGQGIEGDHSPFALALFEALAGDTADVYPPGDNGQPPGDGLLTANELFQYIQYQVPLKAKLKAEHIQQPGLWPLKRHHSGEYVFRVPGRKLSLENAPPLTYENNPYRGLQSFDQEHRHLFYGRTAAIEELARKVTGQPFTVVLGASGTGKSSLVKAGLIPYLQGYRPEDSGNAPANTEPADSITWHILLPPSLTGQPAPPIRPTEAPLRELQKLLATLPEADNSAASPAGLSQRVAAWEQVHPKDHHLLLVVDQFEELITLHRQENDAARERFLRELTETVTQHPDRFHLVLTLRSDFEPRFAKHPLLQPLWGDEEEMGQTESNGKPNPEASNDASLNIDHPVRFVVKPMVRAELRQAIIEPAAEAVLFFDPYTLVDRLVDEVIQMPGALPLLSFTLFTLYIKYIDSGHKDRALTGQNYKDIGGVVGALSTQADNVYKSLPNDATRKTMQRVMLRVIALEGGGLARRRVFRDELKYGDEAEDERVATVLTQLEQARLIVSDKSDDRAYVEPAHDALVNAWPQLTDWKQQEGDENILLQRRVTDAASEWKLAEETTSQPDNLWHNNVRLPQVEEELERSLCNDRSPFVRWLLQLKDYFLPRPVRSLKPYWLNALEMDFIQQSINQRRRNHRWTLWTVSIVMGLLAIAAIFSNNQRIEAVRQANISEARALVAKGRLVSDNDPLLGLRLILEAREVLPKDEGDTSSDIDDEIRNIIRDGRLSKFGNDDVTNIFVNSDSSLFVVAYQDASGELYRTVDGAKVLTLTDIVDKVFFNPDPSSTDFVVDYANAPDELRHVDSTTAITLTHPKDFYDSLDDLYFINGTDSTYFVTRYCRTGDDDIVCKTAIQNTSDNNLVKEFGTIKHIRLSPDSANSYWIIIDDEDDDLSLYRRDDALSQVLSNEEASIAFSPDADATYFALEYTDDEDKIVTKLYDTAMGEPVKGLKGSIEYVYFNPDSEIPNFVIDYRDRPGELRRIANGELIATLGLTDTVADVYFSQDPHAQNFIVTYHNSPSELRSFFHGGLIKPLTAQVVKANFGKVYFGSEPNSAYFGIRYDYSYDFEVRQLADGELVQFEDAPVNLDLAVLSAKEASTLFFSASYDDGTIELHRYFDNSVVAIGNYSHHPSTGADLSELIVNASSDPEMSYFTVTLWYNDYDPIINRLYRSKDSRLLTTFPIDTVEELYQTDILFSPDARHLVATYYSTFHSEEITQLIGTTDGKPVPLNGNISTLNFTTKSTNSDFVVDYTDGRSELWGVRQEPVLLTKLGENKKGHFFGPKNQILVVWYQNGEAYSVDTDWLRKISEYDLGSLTGTELTKIACIPFNKGLFNENILADEQYLGNSPPQACQ